MESTEIHTHRLRPGDDLKKGLEALAKAHNILAGWIITCVGSLTTYHLRFANQAEGATAAGFFEITSLTGTLSRNGCHVHVCVSDENGRTIGGHLLEGCIIYTTAEIVLGSTGKLEFKRELDETTGFNELVIVNNGETEPPATDHKN